MSKIKIFVSHRIDIHSELVENSLYIPMRCGAVFDNINPMRISGDNTGDNISERRMSFCEFTVQYWAWKNCKADFYGLCHYRRYLSFASRHFPTNEFNMIYEYSLLPCVKRKYGLLNQQVMETEICRYDGIVSEYADVSNIPTPKGRMSSVREMWEAYDDVFIKKTSIDLLFQLIDDMFPQYSKSAREYFKGNKHRGFNCFILRKELFKRLCEFQFPIMFAVERQLDTTGYTQTMQRTPAFLGEMLYGIFLYHITTYEQWEIAEKQLLFINNTEYIKGRKDIALRYIWHIAEHLSRSLIDPVLPKGSLRRERAKTVFYKVFPARQRGVANIEEKDNI